MCMCVSGAVRSVEREDREKSGGVWGGLKRDEDEKRDRYINVAIKGKKKLSHAF